MTTTRFMALLKDPAAESGTTLDPEREAGRAKLMKQMEESGVLLGTVNLQPSAKGARLSRDGDRVTVIDGPFAESKELVAGYALVEVPSKEVALEWARRFAEVVETPEVDLRTVA